MKTLRRKGHAPGRMTWGRFSCGRFSPGRFSPGRSRREPIATRPSASRRGGGFTLIEMMIVIVIIGVLMALILPALSAARVRANETRVITEIKQLEAAIAAFKAKYGIDPPSQFSLYLTLQGWQNDPVNFGVAKRIWPQMDFTMGAGAGVTFPNFWQGMAQNSPNGALNMGSGECLLFFLGGVIDVPGTGQAPIGFAKNPLYPFSPRATTTNREGPYFEFSDMNRIKDVDGNQINEWYDTLPSQVAPYLYFSSYDGQGYRLNELPLTAPAPNGAYLYLHDVYRVWSPPQGQPPNEPTAPASPAYANGLPNPQGSQLLPPQKSQSCQIISPGYDGQYGAGGIFNSNLPNSGLVFFDPVANQVKPDTVAYDNLTNFNGGRLKP